MAIVPRATGNGKQAHILYLGDHDPSGMDMIRDITDRLSEFNSDVIVQHIALTDQQIARYNPPPNPAKVSDPRAKDYIAEYGATSWEVDALKPEVLNELLESNINLLIDYPKYVAILEQEKRDIALMKKFQQQSAEEMEDDS